MAQSKHRPKHKAKKKAANIQKVKQKQMENIKNQKAGENPVSFQFHKDATHVSVPINAYKTLVQCARVLEPLAMMISTMEQIGQAQIDAGELLPVYMDDTEEIPGAAPQVDPNTGKASIPRRIKDSFWIRGKKDSIIQTFEKPSIVMADGKTIYDSSQTSDVPVDKVGSAE